MTGSREVVQPLIPAFLMYEQTLAQWLSGMVVSRDLEGRTIPVRVEYAGGEKAVRAIKELHGVDSRNNKVATPVVTMKQVGVEYNQERYHPPESTWAKVYNTPDKRNATRVARASKASPWRVSYELRLYPNFEIDLRYMQFQILNAFHHMGGMAYLTIQWPQTAWSEGLKLSKRSLFPLWLRGYTPTTTSETGDKDRDVGATMMVELECYLPLPLRFVPTFRAFYQTIASSDGSPLDGPSKVFSANG
jgi:hypothetical protein